MQKSSEVLVRRAIGSSLLFLAGLSGASAGGTTIGNAAARFAPDVTWRAGSALVLDFTCRGRREHALLGTAPDSRTTAADATHAEKRIEVVLAVFVEGLSRPPKLLRMSELSASAAELSIESLDLHPSDMRRELGAVPSGWRSSKTCKGLNLGDGAVDSFHIYWHHTRRGMGVWRL